MILFNAEKQILLLIRLQQLLVRKRVKMLPFILQYYMSIVYGCSISPLSKIGKNLKIAHANGIVIGAGSVIGDNVVIFQQVTLGSQGGNDNGQKSYPTIEDNVKIYAGAKIIGGITIGSGSIIGANAVVINSIHPFSVAVGVPAKVIKTFTNG